MGEVVVVGAGPVGMTAALALARHGVPTILADSAEAHSGQGSKAICIQRDVLDVFDRLGVGRAMADEGVSWTLGRTYFRSRELFQTRLAQSQSVFPPFVNLPQSRSEELLLTAVQASADIDLRWQWQLVGLHDDGDEVELSFHTPDGHETVHAAWVVGCDGGRSAVRKLLGIDFPGRSYPDRFLIADVRADLPFPDERRFFFDPPFNPGRQVLIHPQPDGIWRFDWQVPPETDVEEERRSGRLDERIRAIVGDAPYDLVWLSNYTFHQRVADRFQAGQVLLAGDAAHLMSPFGARGMNSGVQDAENLAWKLGLVVAGVAPPALAATYSEERRAAAFENLRVTDETMRFMVPASPLRKLLRNAILRASRLPAVRGFVNSGRLATPYDYSGSSIVLENSASQIGPQPGELAPDVPTQHGRLRELIGPDFLAIAFTTQDWTPRADSAVPVRVMAMAPVEPFQADRWYLIRPDGHLGAGALALTTGVADVVSYCTGNPSLVAV